MNITTKKVPGGTVRTRVLTEEQARWRKRKADQHRHGKHAVGKHGVSLGTLVSNGPGRFHGNPSNALTQQAGGRNRRFGRFIKGGFV